MKLYTQLLEAAGSNKPSNTHITHFEDVVFYRGYGGVRSALDLALSINNNPDAINLSEKFDGAPAIFFGRAPQSGKFFVATKSIFNKDPKIFYSAEEIKDNTKSPELAKKLTYAHHFLQELKPTGILQADMLFIKGDVKTKQIKGNGYLTFHPNTLVYGVESDTSLAHDVIRAKIGIVLHTKWSGKDIQQLSPEFNVTKSDYEEATNVFIHDPTINAREIGNINIEGMVKKALAMAKAAKPQLDKIAGTKGLGQALEQHHNSLVRRSSTSIGGVVYLNSLKKFMKEKRPKMLGAITDDLKPVLELHVLMEKIKTKIYKHLNKNDREIKSFVQEHKTIIYESDIEGYVANKKGKYPLKFVDRAKFSRYNFDDKSIDKGWTKHD